MGRKKKIPPILVQVESDVILTDEQWEESSEYEQLVDFVLGNAKEYNPSPRRDAELMLIPGFKTKYLKLLFDHMARGLSYESFGGQYGITSNRKRRWEDNIYEWRAVKEIGTLAHFEKWEQRMIDVATGQVQYGNATLIIAKLKSFRDEYNPEKKVANLHAHILPNSGAAPVFEFNVVAPREIKAINE